MLMERASEPSTATESAASLERGNDQWTAFLGSLQAKGYFRGELEGSRDHQLLMTTAREYFTQQNLAADGEKDDREDSTYVC